MRKGLFIAVIISLAGVACGGGQTNLDGTSWHLVSLDGSSPIEAESATITLQFQNGEMRGRSGCNQYSGAYSAFDEGDISVEGVAVTEMACLDLEGVMDQEQVYLGILTGATGWEVDGGQLYIYDEAGRTLLYDADGG
jgi:heat shock protein HslJ